MKWNQIHPTIKLTMNHTSIKKNEPQESKCECEETYEIPFPDVSCSIREGKIHTDLYRKETDRNQYLLPTSCHPKQVTKSIPFSLGLRIFRVCSDEKDRDQRLSERKKRLLDRDYNEDMVDTALKKARAVPRKEALKQHTQYKKTKRPVLCTPYDIRLPAVSTIQAKHWRAMKSQDSYLGGVFKEPPLTAYKETKT